MGEAGAGTEVSPDQRTGLLNGAWDLIPPVEKSWVLLAQSEALDAH